MRIGPQWGAFMLMRHGSVDRASAHVIVLGNEKGGSGKSTTAHAYRGRAAEGRPARRHDRSRQPPEELHPLHRESPRLGQARAGSISKCPTHYCIARGRRRCGSTRTRRSEFADFAAAIDAIEHTHDFVVIDTPGNDTYLMRLAHSMADTLITPLNDSFVDFDVLGTVDPTTFAVTGDEPLRRDGARGAPPAPPGRWRHRPTGSWCATACRRSARATSGWSARASTSFAARSASAPSTVSPSAWSIREFFPRGLTALDDLDEATLGTRPSMSHVTARQEVMALLNALKLPLSTRTASAAPPLAPNGTRSWTSRSRSTIF